MLRQLRNYRFDPFSASSSAAVITDEVHTIPGSGTYWVRLHEVADDTYTDPTSGTPVYIRNDAGSVFSEVSGSPGLNEFRVDYIYKTGWVEFNSGNAGQVIYACYRGTGSPMHAELLNALQYLAPFSPFFGGDGSDGAATISVDTNLSESPAGEEICVKNYTNLTIASGKTLGVASGVHGLVLNVQGLLKLGTNAKISLVGKGGAAGASMAVGGPGGYGAGGGSSYWNGSTYDPGYAGGTTPGGLFVPGAGVSGAGATTSVNGGAGVAGLIADSLYWRTVANLLVYGAGGGGGGQSSGCPGGAGAGFLLIFANSIEVASGVLFDCSGSDGTANGNSGGGGGAGGTVFIVAQRLAGIDAATLESTYCDVSGGAGGVSTYYDAGGAGAAGYKKALELYSYNVR